MSEVLATETWTGSNGAAWPSQWTCATVGSSSATIQTGAGKMLANPGAAYTPGVTVSLNSATSVNFDVTADISFESISESYFYLCMRSHNNGDNAYCAVIFPGNGTMSANVSILTNGNDVSLSGDLGAGAWSAGVSQRIRFQVIDSPIGGNPSQVKLRFKIWDPAGAQPLAWLWEGEDTVYYGISGVPMAFYATGASGVSVAANIDNLTIYSLATSGVPSMILGGSEASVGWSTQVSGVEAPIVSWSVMRGGVEQPLAIVPGGSSGPTGPSGIEPETGNLTNGNGSWIHRFTTGFDTDVSLGLWPESDPGYSLGYIDAYPSGWTDTSGNGHYDPHKTATVSASVLNIRMHTEGGTPYVCAPQVGWDGNDVWNGQTYGRYSVCMRTVHVSGIDDYRYKIAFLLWPDSNVWPDGGEIDYPETDLQTGSYAQFNCLYAQPSGGWDNYTVPPSMTIDDWHVYTIEWSPGKVQTFIDGISVGICTTVVPVNPMHWVLQCETFTSGAAPDASTVKDVQIDWVAVWSRA